MKGKIGNLEPKKLDDSSKKSFKIRTITALVGLIIIVPCILFGDWAMFALAFAILSISLYELVKCSNEKFSPWLYVGVIIIGLLICYWPIFRKLINNSINGVPSTWAIWSYFDTMYLSLILIFIGVFILFLLVVLKENFTVRDACFLFTMTVVIAIGLQSILFVRYYPSIVLRKEGTVLPASINIFDNLEASTLCIYVMFSTIMTDTGAYLVGMFFGRHKINERISPKKTTEGYFGGIIISAVLSSILALIFAATNHPILIGVFDLNHWYLIIILSICLPFVGALGDFIFSSIKRFYNIKDFGKILPGHGGILDRLDSLTFTFIFTAIFISFATGNYLI